MPIHDREPSRASKRPPLKKGRAQARPPTDPLQTDQAAPVTHLHLTSPLTYFLVYAALLLLLGATVAAAFIDLGFLNLVITLAIAAAKAALVVTYFMHVKGSDPAIKLFAVTGFLWLAILMGLTLTDYLSRP